MLTKEINEVRVCSIVKKSIEDAYQQGIDDTIEEILKHKYCVYDDDGIGRIVVNVSDIKQIKEHTNG